MKTLPHTGTFICAFNLCVKLTKNLNLNTRFGIEKRIQNRTKKETEDNSSTKSCQISPLGTSAQLHPTCANGPPDPPPRAFGFQYTGPLPCECAISLTSGPRWLFTPARALCLAGGGP
jgi:hypothetical protein